MFTSQRDFGFRVRASLRNDSHDNGAKMKILAAGKKYVSRMRLDTYTLYLAMKNPRVPWYAKIFSALVVAYAFCPVDLIPDFIPILGYLDDCIIIPASIFIAIKMIPPEVIDECRANAGKIAEKKPRIWLLAPFIVAVWFGVAYYAVYYIRRGIK